MFVVIVLVLFGQTTLARPSYSQQNRQTPSFQHSITMRLSLLPIVALAGTALASGATISKAIYTIANSTLELNKTIAHWPRNIIGTVPIFEKSTILSIKIHNGTRVARASKPLSEEEALQVAKATQKLSLSVNTTLETIIHAKYDFDHLTLSRVILLNLELQRDLSKDLAEAVIDKVPKELKDTARQLIKTIDDSFKKAIRVYHRSRR